jgi:hypothetical protein
MATAARPAVTFVSATTTSSEAVARTPVQVSSMVVWRTSRPVHRAGGDARPVGRRRLDGHVRAVDGVQRSVVEVDVADDGVGRGPDDHLAGRLGHGGPVDADPVPHGLTVDGVRRVDVVDVVLACPTPEVDPLLELLSRSLMLVLGKIATLAAPVAASAANAATSSPPASHRLALTATAEPRLSSRL